MKTKCRVCNVVLTHENWAEGNSKSYNNICKTCHNIQNRAWVKANPEKARKHSIIGAEKYRRKNGVLPMSTNRECSAFLGVYVAERVLSLVFKDVQRMPYGNPGYDVICNKDKMIDIKSACLRCDHCWVFNIKRNNIADYFLCLAFDNREDLNPLHVWLLPGGMVNKQTAASISPSTVQKWAEHELDISNISACCDVLKQGE